LASTGDEGRVYLPKSFGELEESIDPEIFRMGQPHRAKPYDPYPESIGKRKQDLLN